MREVLSKIYYDVLNPAGYSSARKLYVAARKIIPSITIKEIKKWLSHQDTYTRHHKVKRKFRRRKTLARGIDHVWQMDLCDLSKLSRFNKGFKFLLTVIDVFSRYAFVRPLRNKTGLEVSKAIDDIFKTAKRNPSKIGVDFGSEFYNRNVRALLDKYNIKLYSVHNEPKMAIVERFNRTLKSRMWKYFTRHNTERYINVLGYLVTSYNNTYHRTIGMSPSDVNESNESMLWQKLYQKDFLKSVKYKYEIGDHVRISKIKQTFEKGYLPNWTNEIFIIYQRHATNPVTYKLKDLQNENLMGSFYEDELIPVGRPKMDIISHIDILKTRKHGKTTQHYIHYKGWDSRFDEWMDKADLVNI